MAKRSGEAPRESKKAKATGQWDNLLHPEDSEPLFESDDDFDVLADDSELTGMSIEHEEERFNPPLRQDEVGDLYASDIEILTPTEADEPPCGLPTVEAAMLASIAEEPKKGNPRGFSSMFMLGTYFGAYACLAKYKDFGSIVKTRDSTPRFVQWQLEICPKTNRLHIQFYIVWSTRTWSGPLQKALSCALFLRRGTHRQARDYCKKQDTRALGSEPCTFGEDLPEVDWDKKPGARTDMEDWMGEVKNLDKPLYSNTESKFLFMPGYTKQAQQIRTELVNQQNIALMRARLDQIVLREWQVSLLAKIKEPWEARKIIWVVQLGAGGAGKTTFCDYVEMYHNGQVFKGGKGLDMAHHIENDKDVYLFDYQFDEQEGKEKYISYTFVEQVKDMRVAAHKYESKAVILRPNTVVCFSNFFPAKGKFSPDRLVLFSIEEMRLVPVTEW